MYSYSSLNQAKRSFGIINGYMKGATLKTAIMQADLRTPKKNKSSK